MKPFEVRPYREGDASKVLNLFNEVFAEDDPEFVPRTLEEWQWEFLDNPAGTQIMLGVTEDEEIIAQYACLPAFANLDGERVKGIQGIDSVVHRDYRRGLKKEGAFLATARAFFDYWGVPERNAFGWGCPNSKVYRLGVRVLGYIPVETPIPVIFRNLFETPNDEGVATFADGDATVEEIDRFDERADRLFERLRRQLPMAIIRDSTYLNWRYTDCPATDYRLWALLDPSGDYRALAVSRDGFQGHPIRGISEWIVDEEDRGGCGALLQHLLRDARDKDQKRVEMWMSPRSRLAGVLLEAGMKSEPGLHNLCMMLYRKDVDIDWAKQNFRYSYGDLDVF